MSLTVRDLQFSYNGHPVFTDVAFELQPGEITSILGINGAGKSTLLKCLNRILNPDSGRVILGERNLFDLSANDLARHLGYVPQKAGNELLTVFDAVLLGRKPYIKWSVSGHDLGIVEQVLELMELSHFAQRPANRLSGGELQKVLIARALAQEPDVLLLDEPTSNLDMKNQIQVMDLITNAVRKQGISAIIAVHDINLALRYSNRFLLMKDGTIRSLDSTDHITAEVIRDVYGVDVVISRINEQTVVVPIDTRS